ncbi:beta-aspartyl-peptidase (threonine type) [Roseateles sp. YR242]|uniref:isoaspartyl peptidase/L-asparaginase family protein n=1 Tax=Roseateles sp. YR242 TaxID=1855305 RepID=UPI0008D1A89C|nr:isoaspartyl peptidase/L-asparaginase [Roseateles sp. YR242]SEK35849.1 beta-aspartyl-peptidase (threonine type) [Roseateles sp. YR242]
MRISSPPASAAPRDRAVLAIHGGAGTILRSRMSGDMESDYRSALQAVLAAGERMLAQGASAVEVAVASVQMLEECELFNAGKGAVYTALGRHELDASVMDGSDLSAGAVAGVTTVRNPVLAAQAVMRRSGHVMLIGAAADRFAQAQGLACVDPGWFGTPQRLAQLRQVQEQSLGQVLDHSGPIDERDKFGTVGAVVLDTAGHLAAATSTGGMTNKRDGRVGDSPILGAGCYADDRSVAVSCTGTGEAFIRVAAAHEVAALIRIGGLSLEAACQRVLFEELPLVDGDGGLIAVDRHGHVHLGFNTEGMYRGAVRIGAAPAVGVYRED